MTKGERIVELLRKNGGHHLTTNTDILRWLRDEKKRHVLVFPSTPGKWKTGLVTLDITDPSDGKLCIMYHKGSFGSYEEAEEAGILWTLQFIDEVRRSIIRIHNGHKQFGNEEDSNS